MAMRPSISAALIGQPSWYDYMGLKIGTPETNRILGAINGVYAAGGAFGCVWNMWCAEYFGRRRSIQIGSVISIVGATIMTASQDIPMFIVSRFIMGFGIGQLVTLVPLYQSEVSPPESRGLMVGLHGVLIGFSYSLTGFVTYGCKLCSFHFVAEHLLTCFKATLRHTANFSGDFRSRCNSSLAASSSWDPSSCPNRHVG